MNRKYIYLDYNATTPMHNKVVKQMETHLSAYGNCSSEHELGEFNQRQLQGARQKIKCLLHIPSDEKLIFTSGSTESNNMLIQGVARYFMAQRKTVRFLSSAVEHPSVLNTFRFLSRHPSYNEYIKVEYVKLTKCGRVHQRHLRRSLVQRPPVALVSFMMVNHETGLIEHLHDLVRIIRESSPSTLIHSDMTQAMGKFPINIKALSVDACSFSAHKFYGPKGIGGLYMKSHINLEQLMFGGNQEYMCRPGTESVLLTTAMAKALEVSIQLLPHMKQYSQWKRKFYQRIKTFCPVHVISKCSRDYLPTTMSMAFPYSGKELSLHLSQHGIYVSRGAACKSKSKAGSNVLAALDLTDKQKQGVLRISMGFQTRWEDLERLLHEIESFCKR
jgi:cysteine desulfurase